MAYPPQSPSKVKHRPPLDAMLLHTSLAGLSAAAAALTIAGITTDEVAARKPVVVGGISGATSTAAAREAAEREVEIAELKRRLAEASASNADDNVAISQANSSPPAAEGIDKSVAERQPTPPAF